MAKFTSNDEDSLKIFTHPPCTQRTATPKITEAHFYICNLSVINFKTIIIILHINSSVSWHPWECCGFFQNKNNNKNSRSHEKWEYTVNNQEEEHLTCTINHATIISNVTFRNWLRCMSYLYILDLNSLSVISFANIFSHSVCGLFILSVVSFSVQKLLSLIRSHQFIFACISFALGHKPHQKIIATIYDRVFCLSFLLGIIIVSSLIFRSLIHF